MEALAMYLWHLLSSCEDSDSDEEEVELPQVKLPEITVLRKHEDIRETISDPLRKKVTFARPLHQNAKEPTDSSGGPAPEYRLVQNVPLTDHSYVNFPLVCSHQLNDGSVVRVPAQVKEIQNGRPVIPIGNLRRSTMKYACNSVPTTPQKSFLRREPLKVPDKKYKPVNKWDELLEQFDTKPEDGNRLLDDLITALGGEVENGVDGSKDRSGDAECPTAESDNGDDSDDDSVKIIDESFDISSIGGRLPTKQSDKESTGNVYRQLFDKYAKEDDPGYVTACDVENQDSESTQYKYHYEQPRDAERSINTAGEHEVLESKTEAQTDNTDESIHGPTDPSTDSQRRTFVIENGKMAANIRESSGPTNISAARPPTIIIAEVSSLSKNPVTPTMPEFGELCNWALSFNDPAATTKKRKQNYYDGESSNIPTVKKKKKRQRCLNAQKDVPIEKLSKHCIMARLARQIRLSQDPRTMMDDEEFKVTFGVSKEFANHLLCQLSPLFPSAHETSRETRTPDHTRVLTALQFFASGNRNKQVGQITHLSQPAVSRCIQEVISTLINNSPEPELPTSDSEFHELYGLPDVIGAVDAMHVPIKPPNSKCVNSAKKETGDNHLYKNSYEYYSINVEIVSSSSNRILFCDTKQPGSYTKNQMWQESKVREMMIARHEVENPSDRLIAGAAYDCEPWLLSPCSITYSHSPQHKYNTSLTSALQDSSRLTIGLLKGRFKCLSTASDMKALYYSPDKSGQVVTACCILHNMAMDFGEEMPDPLFDEFDLVETSNETRETNWDGLEARNSYILEHFC